MHYFQIVALIKTWRVMLNIPKCMLIIIKITINFVVIQPPKKKGGKKGKKKKSAKAKTPTVIDGVSTEEMSKDQVGCFVILIYRISIVAYLARTFKHLCLFYSWRNTSFVFERSWIENAKRETTSNWSETK